jgi:DNA polymerase III alpha subunit
MKVDEYGIVHLSEKECIDALYSTSLNDLSNIVFDIETAQKFNSALNLNKDSFSKLLTNTPNLENITEFDKKNQSKWFMPENYCPDLVQEIYSKCKTPEQIERVTIELELYVKHNMLNLLYYLKYLVDTMRQNNIVWGVGRGSSVASYVLFLIGVHKVDSLKYHLDIYEFFKSN